MKIHVDQNGLIDGIAYIGPMEDGIDIDSDKLPKDFELLKYKYIDGQFVDANSSRAVTLEEAVSNKLSELSSICEDTIKNGIEVNGYRYSMTDQDQINLEVLKGAINDGATQVAYHADDESCRMYDKDEFMQIYLSCASHKIHHITYFNQLKRYTKSLNNVEEIMDITYGQELTGVYLETYNEIYNWLLSLRSLYA